MKMGNRFALFTLLFFGFLAIIAILSFFLGKNPRQRISERYQDIKYRYNDRLMERGENTGAHREKNIREQARSSFRAFANVIDKLPMTNAKDRAKAAVNLGAAGYTSPNSIKFFFGIKFVITITFVLLAYSFPFVSLILDDMLLATIASMLMGALVGGMLPNLVLGRLAVRRRGKIEKALPDALDLMCICTSAGYSLDMSVERVANEMREVSPVLAHELDVTARELKFLPDRHMPLRNLSNRVDLMSVRNLTVALIQAQKFGTPLIVALKNLAENERRVRMLAIEEKAARIPVLITLPLMVFTLPTLFIILGTPAVIQVKSLMGN